MVRNPFRPNVLWGEGGEFPDFICCENPNTRLAAIAITATCKAFAAHS